MLPAIILCPTVRGRAESDAAAIYEKEDGETRVASRIWELLFGGPTAESDSAEIRLIPGGDVFGVRIHQGYVSLSDGIEEIGLCEGDVIEAVDGQAVTGVGELVGLVALGDEHTLSVRRGGKSFEVGISDGECKRELCSVVRDGVAGIGTVTFINPVDMSFGGLGHGISGDTGSIIPANDGRVTGVIIGGAIKGEKGKPGELSGILTDRAQGKIFANTPVGVFGKLENVKVDKSASLPVADRSEVKAGAATIISTVKNGRKAEYTVEIFDIQPNELGTKCFKVRVTDRTLLALTGGIVRGMSGSPIIQNGRLVGAVTHVMINDPTVGYGIFIENMLSAAKSEEMPKAA